MKKIIDENFKQLETVQGKLKPLEQISVEYEKLLSQTFFSKDWKGLLNPILIISIFLEMSLRESVSYDISQIWYWGNIIFGVIHFVGIIATTLIYFRWRFIQRKIKIIKCEIEFRFQYIKNLLADYETQIKSIKNEQS
jgi:hypothetical protein